MYDSRNCGPVRLQTTLDYSALAPTSRPAALLRPALCAALALGPVLACGKSSRSDTPAATSSATVTASASVSASVAVSARPSAAPASSSSASPAERFAANLASAKADVGHWGCSANQPVIVKAKAAALLTFRCPDDSNLVAFDARSNGGFLLIDGVSEGYAIGRGTLDTEVKKRRDGGLSWPVRDGKTNAVLLAYTIWHLSAVPGGYRLGQQLNYENLFSLVDGAWIEDVAPKRPEDGFRFGRDGTLVFPVDGTIVEVAPGNRRYPLVESFEAWDGKAYSADLDTLVPVYRARLKSARAFLAMRLPRPAPSASAAPSAPSSSSSVAAPAPPPSGSVAAPRPAAPKTDERYEDIMDGCPLGVVRASAEVFAYSRLLDDAPIESAELAERAVTTLVSELDCTEVVVKNLPTWNELRQRLEREWLRRTFRR